MTVENVSLGSNTIPRWRELYLAVLFETDKQKLPSRIGEAERALLSRARELLLASEHRGEEGRALDKGLYALRALRACFCGSKTSLTVKPRQIAQEGLSL